MSKDKPGKGRRIDGLGAAAEMLSGLDPEHRKRLLEQVYRRDPKIASSIERRMYGFEDLRNVTDQDRGGAREPSQPP